MRTTQPRRNAGTGYARCPELVRAIIADAEERGLLYEKNDRLDARVSRKLIRQAKARTGIASDADVVEFALAYVALDGSFAEAFRTLKGTVDPDTRLGY